MSSNFWPTPFQWVLFVGTLLYVLHGRGLI